MILGFFVHFQVTEELGPDELIRRLKSLAHTFQVLQQAEDDQQYVDYSPLALHLADDFFLNHASRDVQLLVRFLKTTIFESILQKGILRCRNITAG